MRGADRLRRERRGAEDRGADHREEKPPAQEDRRAPDEDRDAKGGDREHPGHVIRVAEAAEVGDEDEEAIRLGGVRLVAPAHHEPGTDREPGEGDGVDLLVHHRVAPDGERGGTDQHGERAADDPLPPLGEPPDEDAFGDQEPHPGAHGARERGEEVHAHRDVRGDREDRRHAADEHEERIPRRMGSPIV